MDRYQCNCRSSKSTTTISDLNDDCLLHVLEHLNQDDLCGFADVSSRFRRNAQDYFKRSEFKYSYMMRKLGNWRLLKAARVLRLFGKDIKKITLVPFFGGYPIWNEYALQLVEQYCTLIEMQLYFCEIENNMVQLMRALLPNLQKLSLRSCKIDWKFSNEMLRLAPRLKELGLSFVQCHTKTENEIESCTPKPYTMLYQTLPKLEKFVLERCHVGEINLDIFLKWNPQMKDIQLLHLFGDNSDQNIRLIFKHGPCVEKIRYEAREVSNSTAKYFGKLKHLKSLELCIFKTEFSMWTVAVVREIVAADIPLEHLRLRNVILGNESKRFVKDIIKLKALKTLTLKFLKHLSAHQILEICAHLKELTELDFYRNDTESIFSVANLLELIQKSRNLRLFRYCNLNNVEKKIRISADEFQQMVNASVNHRESKHLEICLNENGYTANVPSAFSTACKHFFTLSVGSQPKSDDFHYSGSRA